MVQSLILCSIIMMDVLTGMEFDLFVPSFPALQAHFQISAFWVEALLSVNFIGYGLSLFLVGKCADKYGRRPVLLLGMSIFLLGGILCLWPDSFYSMLLGRFLQGVGIAAPAILSFLIIADNYPLEKQQSLMGILNGFMNIAVALAPILGSYISFYFGWRGNFIALLLLAVLALMMTLLFIPNYPTPQKAEDGSQLGYWGLLKIKPLLLLIANIVFMIVPYWIFVGMSPLLYLQSFAVSLQHFGYYQGALAFIFALGSFAVGWILPLLQHRTWLWLSAAIIAFSIGTLGLVTWENSTNPLAITLAFIPFVIAQILPAVLLYPLCLNYRIEAKGKAAALIQAGRLILCTLSLQLAGFYYQGTFQNIGALILIVMLLVLLTLIWILRNYDRLTATSGP